MTITESAYIAVDWAIEVEDVDLFVSTAAIAFTAIFVIEGQAVLVKVMIVQLSELLDGEAAAAVSWVFHKRSFTDFVTTVGADALADVHVEHLFSFAGHIGDGDGVRNW